MDKKLILFTPGPVMTSKRLKSALAHPDIPHRRRVFEEYFDRNRANLLRLFRTGDQYTAVIISGSGTAANETALSSIIKDTDEVLLIKNGVFGERLDEILSCYQYTVQRLAFPWGQLPDLKTVEDVLVKNENIQWVCMVYHETSTGMINPVHEVGELVNKYGRKYFVDCVSAIGGENVDVVRDHIDIATGSANKAISGTTGVSFVCAKRSSVPVLEEEVPRRNVYLNLQKHIEWADQRNQTPNTPSVTMFVALDVALQELFEEGLENRIERYKTCARIIRDGVRSLGLELLMPDEQCSNTVTSAFLPEGVNLDNFIDELERRGYVLYPGKGPFYDQNLFQIANMGWILPEDCHKFLSVLGDTLNDMLDSTRKVDRLKPEGVPTPTSKIGSD